MSFHVFSSAKNQRSRPAFISVKSVYLQIHISKAPNCIRNVSKLQKAICHESNHRLNFCLNINPFHFGYDFFLLTSPVTIVALKLRWSFLYIFWFCTVAHGRGCASKKVFYSSFLSLFLLDSTNVQKRGTGDCQDDDCLFAVVENLKALHHQFSVFSL